MRWRGKDHVRYYGRDIKKKLEEVGFNVIVADASMEFSKEEISMFGLSENDIFYICRRS